LIDVNCSLYYLNDSKVDESECNVEFDLDDDKLSEYDDDE